MWQDIVGLIQNHPEIAVFLALAMGYAIGKIKIFGVNFGPTTGVLLSALLIGQIAIEIPDILKNISFALFTFCIGYKVGPQFFGALRKDGLNYIWISVLVAAIGLGGAIFIGKAMHFDKGTTAGFFAGSMTESAALGTAEGAINNLPLSAEQKKDLNTNVAVAYAITYIFGTGGVLIFLKIAPKLLRINLREEAKKLEAQMSGGEEPDKPDTFSWTKRLDLRTYRLTNKDVVGKTIRELKTHFTERVSIEKIRRNNDLMETTPDMKIEADDILIIIAHCKDFLDAQQFIGPEVDSEKMGNIAGEALDICVLNAGIVGKTLGEIGKNENTRGVFLKNITRQGHGIPITKSTVIHKCDVLQVVGTREKVEQIVKLTGYPERKTDITDLIMVGAGCVIGTLIGMIAVPVAGIPLTLGMGGGVLVTGLVFGWLRAVHPTFGQIPTSSQWILQNMGLNLFVACIGLSAGAKAVQAFQTAGFSVFFGGAILSLLPIIVGLLFGLYVLRMNPVLLFGAVAGARVLTAALNMLQEDTGSATPVLGYAAPYAFGNVLLTIWGSIIVNVM